MRQVKFRAWDGENMFLSPSINEPHHLGSWLESHSTFGKNGKESVFMQFTGLLDKNGVEIYEGDIVKIEDVIGNPLDGWKDGVYKVEYCLPDCAFCLVQLDQQNAVSFNETFQYEVIGNIYESPEFLNP